MEASKQKPMTQINNLYNELNNHIFLINDSILQMNIIINQINEIMKKNNMINKNNQNNPNNIVKNILNDSKNNHNENIFLITYEDLRKRSQFGQIKDKEQAGDFIFELAEILYKHEAGKITGMILEHDLNKLENMIFNEPMRLKEEIDLAHKLLQENR